MPHRSSLFKPSATRSGWSFARLVSRSPTWWSAKWTQRSWGRSWRKGKGWRGRRPGRAGAVFTPLRVLRSGGEEPPRNSAGGGGQGRSRGPDCPETQGPVPGRSRGQEDEEPVEAPPGTPGRIDVQSALWGEKAMNILETLHLRMAGEDLDDLVELGAESDGGPRGNSPSVSIFPPFQGTGRPSRPHLLGGAGPDGPAQRTGTSTGFSSSHPRPRGAFGVGAGGESQVSV